MPRRAEHGRVRGDEQHLLARAVLGREPLEHACRRRPRSAPRAARGRRRRRRRRRRRSRARRASRRSSRAASTSSRRSRVRAGVEEVVAVEEVERRLGHQPARRWRRASNRKHRRGHAHVERLDRARRAGSRRARRRCGGRAVAAPSPRRRARARLRRRGRCSRDRRGGLARGAVHPELRPLDLLEVARQVRDDRDRQVLDRPGRRTRDGGRHDRRAVRRNDDAGRARAERAPAHGAEVARIGDAVEHDEQRPLDRGELPRVGVAVRLDARDDALMVARARRARSGRAPAAASASPRRATAPPPTARSVAHSSSTCAPPAQRLPHGAPAVDEVGAHRRGTSE